MIHHLAVRLIEGTAVAVSSWLAARAVKRVPRPPRDAPPELVPAGRPPDPNREPLLHAFYDATEAGVDHVYAAEILGRLTGHVTRAAAQRGSSAVYPRVVAAAVAAAHFALWSSYDAGCLVLALQEELDAQGELAIPYLERVIMLVQHGRTVGEILTEDGELAIPRTLPS